MRRIRKFFIQLTYLLWQFACGGVSFLIAYTLISFLSKNLGFSVQLTFIYNTLLLLFEYTLSDIDTIILAISLPIIELSILFALITLLSIWASKKIALKFLRSPF